MEFPASWQGKTAPQLLNIARRAAKQGDVDLDGLVAYMAMRRTTALGDIAAQAMQDVADASHTLATWVQYNEVLYAVGLEGRARLIEMAAAEIDRTATCVAREQYTRQTYGKPTAKLQ